MSTPQDDKKSAVIQWFKRFFSLRWLLPRKRRTDVPTSVSRPLPISSAEGTSSVPLDPVQPDVVMANHGAGHTNMDPSQSSIPTNGTAGCSPRTDVTASRTASSGLPSQVEETLAPNLKFRILLVGNTGVGKSSLVSSVFNVVFNVGLADGPTPDVAHDRVGISEIVYEWRSDQNPRFILHDSMGFEHGSADKSKIVQDFLQHRSPKAELPDQVHAIWLCIETPRTGSRLLQTGDEDLLKLAKERKIPVIVVLTKFDLLVVEHFRANKLKLSVAEKKLKATNSARLALNDAKLEELKDLKVPFVPVSTIKETLEEDGGTMLLELIKETQDSLREGSLSFKLSALWVTAQQINARMKVELSISEGLKKYWQNLGENVFFEGHRLVDCIERIHDDVLKVWNFNDPDKVLSGEEFLKRMIGLVEPLSDEVIRNQRTNLNDIVAGAVGSSLVIPALESIIGMNEYQFLCSKYRKGVSTATYLAAYIVDLTLVLFEISNEIINMMLKTANPPKSVLTEDVMNALATYKSSRSSHIHTQVKEVDFTSKLEKINIASVIRGALPS